MSSVFFSEPPVGNIRERDVDRLESVPGVIRVEPICLGDEYQRHRLVGVRRSFFQTNERSRRKPIELQAGNVFNQDLQVVAGAEAARRLNLSIGSTFRSFHGSSVGKEHAEPLTVVGILASTNSPLDRALFTSIPTYWKLHALPTQATAGSGRDNPVLADSREVTAALVEVARPKMFGIRRQIEQEFPAIQIVRPTEVLTRIADQVLAPTRSVLLWYGCTVVMVALVTIAIVLSLSMALQRKNLSIIRLLGGGAGTIGLVINQQTLLILIVGVGLGLLVRTALLLTIGQGLSDRYGTHVSFARISTEELLAIASIFGFGLLISLIPTWSVVRSNLRDELS